MQRKKRNDNCFDPNGFVVHLNPLNLSNIKFARYDGIRVICETPEPLDCVLFHELVHAFHNLLGRNQSKEIKALNYFYGDNELKHIWVNLENN